jgi:hypothetical protein
MSVGSAYEGANVDEPQELLNIARHHCQAIQTIIDQQSTNHPIGCPKNSISRLSVDQPHNSNKRLLLRGPNRQPPFGSRLTLSELRCWLSPTRCGNWSTALGQQNHWVRRHISLSKTRKASLASHCRSASRLRTVLAEKLSPSQDWQKAPSSRSVLRWGPVVGWCQWLTLTRRSLALPRASSAL